MAAVARTNTKAVTAENVRSIETTDNSYKKNKNRKNASGSDYKRSNVSYSASSIAANANLLLRNHEDRKEDDPADTGATDTKKPVDDLEKTEFMAPEDSSSDTESKD